MGRVSLARPNQVPGTRLTLRYYCQKESNSGYLPRATSDETWLGTRNRLRNACMIRLVRNRALRTGETRLHLPGTYGNNEITSGNNISCLMISVNH